MPSNNTTPHRNTTHNQVHMATQYYEQKPADSARVRCIAHTNHHGA